MTIVDQDHENDGVHSERRRFFLQDHILISFTSLERTPFLLMIYNSYTYKLEKKLSLRFAIGRP